MIPSLLALDYMPGFDAIIEAVKVVGYPIVTGVLLLLMLWWILRNVFSQLSRDLRGLSGKVDEAVPFFNTKLDNMIGEQTAQFRQIAEQHVAVLREVSERQATVVQDLNTTLRLQTEQLARNNEALSIVVQFLSKTQAEVNDAKKEIQQHREAVESAVSKIEEGGNTNA